jgi:hypothetical protein
MLFLVRSAFWLGMVYSAMPFDNSEQTRELARLRAVLAATAGSAAATTCAAQSVSCRALMMATPEGQRGLDASNSARAKEKTARASADSLTEADVAAPWRGKPAKVVRGQALAQRAAMPI